MAQKNLLIAPIVKWVGGKRQLIDSLKANLPKKFDYYIEPFVGGGALLFELQPNNAIINDFNEELMNVYTVVKYHPDELIEILKVHKDNNTEDYFYEIRSLDRDSNSYKLSDIERAARILYLNKTCYNGLYRVNSSGQFNTPYGKYKNPNIVNEPTIRAVSKYFSDNNIQINSGDYKDVLKEVKKNTFVYLDPPYVPISTSSSFTGYTENGFDINKQKELKEQCDILNENGVKFMLSNSDCQFIRELYERYNIKTVKAKRQINSVAHKRGEINEVLVTNYES